MEPESPGHEQPLLRVSDRTETSKTTAEQGRALNPSLRGYALVLSQHVFSGAVNTQSKATGKMRKSLMASGDDGAAGRPPLPLDLCILLPRPVLDVDRNSDSDSDSASGFVLEYA